ncbi:MAG: ATP-binding protein [Syntrophorhabdaceae bacterium]|nr:ATP-binding protein [Syntrophorhabdaceae bacterium]MDD4196932.1 ATP-binding protein [Syntrophorhabdaceae bacterium]
MEGGFENAGRVSSQVKAFLATLDFPKDIIRRAAIVTLEAEMNICSYAHRGHITIRILPHFITIEAVDEGQGIHDIELAMKEGYSTATDLIRSLGFGAGLGLSNMKKFSDTFRIISKVGKGTHVKMLIHIPKEFHPRKTRHASAKDGMGEEN